VPDLLPIRYGRMAVSPFTYYRGAALPMANDLADTPQSGIIVQACGDAHLSNFGLFGSPERNLIFDINDFDETLPAPWEWDVKRLAASMEIAGRDNGFSRKERRRIVLGTVSSYRQAMNQFAGQTALEIWYAHANVDELRGRIEQEIQGGRRKKFNRALAKVRTKDNLGALNRFAGLTDGQPRIVADPPLIVPIDQLAEGGADLDRLEKELRKILDAYRDSMEPERRVLLDRYKMSDMARKVVGVGSVGTRSWMLLMMGDDNQDPLFLQAKEAGRSVLEGFAGKSEYDNCGQRVVVGQRLMQTVSDIFLGWVRVRGLDNKQRDFYVRQLRDWKGSIDIEAMVPRGMELYGQLCGWTLARAHARSGDHIAIAAYLGNGTAFDEAIREFSEIYADQNERDHKALVEAIDSGRIQAIAGL
jgi:uncharacterized protein (DUF2252 family)